MLRVRPVRAGPAGLQELQGQLRGEYCGSDDGITINVQKLGSGAAPALNPASMQKVLFFLMNLPNGVQKMSAQIPGLEETSLNLGILKRWELLILSRVEGTCDGERLNVRAEGYGAVHATGMGKVLISELGEEEIWELFRGREELPAYTPNTITSVSQLLREEAQVRRDGYAVDREEYAAGLGCIAMPVRDYTGKIVAAVSVSSPAGRMDEARRRLILEALGQCSRDISRSLGYRPAGGE